MDWLSVLKNNIIHWIEGMGFPLEKAYFAQESLYFLGSFIVFFIFDKLIIYYVMAYVKKIARKSKTRIDDVLFENRVVFYFLRILTVYLWILVLDGIIIHFHLLYQLVFLTLKLYMDYLMVRGFVALFKSANDIYELEQKGRERSIKSYIQVFQLLTILIGVLVAISIVTSKDISYLLTGIGAFAAVLMLIFKDSILGFVGGIQINANDMVRIGDWISVPEANADGTVTDISLTTVKVQNWDKTISTIPTYSLVSNSFRNWRGMEDSGGRRIKRYLNIDLQSIRFCSDAMLTQLKEIRLLHDYLQHKEDELRAYNSKMGIEGDVKNGRHQTNIGVFRAYVEAYLKANSKIHSEMTFLVRQLQSTEKGLPLEIYVFSKIQDWAQYEAIQADIFDHLLAIIPEFKLKVFQNPSGADFRSIIK